MKKIILILIFFSSIGVKAQYVANYKKIADTYFEKKDYYAAATFYKKYLGITADTLGRVIPYMQEKSNSIKATDQSNNYEESIYKLAESSRLYKEFNEAEKYYATATSFQSEKYYKSKFYYAESLRTNGKFDLAIETFQKFIQNHPTDPLVSQAKMEILSCRFAFNEMRYPRMIQLSRLPKNINGLGSNYAATVSNSDLFFTSSRPTNVKGPSNVLNIEKSTIQVSTKANPYLNALYVAGTANEATEVSVKKLDVNIAGLNEFATPVFSPDGQTVYFTAWQTNKKFSIYSAKKEGDKWTRIAPLNLQVNSTGFNTVQPFITIDGKFMLFSSDRPGGFGKYDLWYVVIRTDGSFGQPVNLGPEINTDQDEKTPYYNIYTQKLLFSTDGRVGLGGFDFFESEGDLTAWSKPKNLGYPFNSSKDDLYFTAINTLGTEGYISSDRESSCCLELFKVKREFISISGKVIDCKTNKPLTDASVTLTDVDGEKTFKTGADGLYKFTVDSKRPIRLSFDKNEYFIVNKNYSYEDLAKADTLLAKDYCLTPFKVDAPIVLENIYFEFNKWELTEPSKLYLDGLVKILNDNPNVEIELSAHTDNIGTDQYNFELSDKRAKSCVDYLINKNIAAGRLVAKGYGKTMPVAPNNLPNGKDNPEGRAKNRRIEFKVLKK